jgi:hypothetical protein
MWRLWELKLEIPRSRLLPDLLKWPDSLSRSDILNTFPMYPLKVVRVQSLHTMADQSHYVQSPHSPIIALNNGTQSICLKLIEMHPHHGIIAYYISTGNTTETCQLIDNGVHWLFPFLTIIVKFSEMNIRTTGTTEYTLKSRTKTILSVQHECTYLAYAQISL